MNRSLGDFAGRRWQIDRVITHEAGQRFTLRGSVAFAPDGAALRYEETGVLQGGGHSLNAQQSYIWREGLAVFFDDGRFFHQIPPQGGATAHWCPPDQYDGTYDFSDWPHWSLTWRVRGPAKAYTSVTHFRA